MSSTNQAVVSITDDEIFRRKLLMDGEGMGDDRKLNLLLKGFLKWSDTKDDAEEELFISFQRSLSSLASCEFAMAKSNLIQQVNTDEIKMYEDLYQKIETGISKAQKDILERKADLQRSKRVRKNKQQYDALARIIAKQPDRKIMLAELKELNEEICNLEKMKADYQMKLEKRHKQFQVLLSAAHELQELVKADGEDDPMEIE